MSQAPEAQPPAVDLQVVTPATDEQVAALVAVLAALPRDETTPPTPPRAWGRPARAVRSAAVPDLGGWHGSRLPL